MRMCIHVLPCILFLPQRIFGKYISGLAFNFSYLCLQRNPNLNNYYKTNTNFEIVNFIDGNGVIY